LVCNGKGSNVRAEKGKEKRRKDRGNTYARKMMASTV
jgi:hypothetical protein